MKKISLILILLLYCVWISKAQNIISVQNNSAPSFFTSLDSAIVHSQNGDTLYLPGGGFTISDTIKKCIHIVGVGHNPDSTQATNYTLISGDIYILASASNSSLTGLYCNGKLRFGNSQINQSVNNLHVSRCNLHAGVLFGFSNTSNANNNTFCENVIPGFIDMYNSHNNAFYNNILELVKNIGLSNIFRNNIFNMSGSVNYSDGYFWYGCQTSFVNAISSIFENNIFRGRLLSSGGYNLQFSNCVFYNNLFGEASSIGSPFCTGCMDFNSLLNQPDSTIFINYPIGLNFQYSLNYQIKNTCHGKNAGTDGTDIGIYGGLFPWKEGSVPLSPHIQNKVIPVSTNPNGNLNVNIKVAAQDE